MRAGLLLSLFSASLHCATCDSQIRVTDPTGASTQGAQIIFSSPAAGKANVITQGKTNAQGVFRATLESGTVHLEVARAGFRRYETDLVIRCRKDEPVRLPVRLELGLRQGDY
ncbi:MAG TPA: carboxypeptidase-like regulatory domain-containing protein [Bryobacteraceae bacterium]|jgi:hypothetical protein|nr:carboxypeptidase-like regulatory domain-containing protein [Bryobacteraceae bacterium]